MTPPRSRTLGDLRDDTAAARSGAEATVFRGERLTYTALKARADDLGALAPVQESS